MFGGLVSVFFSAVVAGFFFLVPWGVVPVVFSSVGKVRLEFGSLVLEQIMLKLL